MKKSILIIALIGLFIGMISCTEKTDKNTDPEVVINSYHFKTSFIKVLENAKAYTLEVAEAMPAEDYTFRTTDSVRTFGEQLAHIGISTQFILVKFIKGEELPESDVTEQGIGKSKELTITMLNKSFDDIIETLNSMDDDTMNEKFILSFLPEKPEYSKHEGFVFLRDHITHHRGQAIVYLRAKGHQAPQYRAF